MCVNIGTDVCESALLFSSAQLVKTIGWTTTGRIRPVPPTGSLINRNIGCAARVGDLLWFHQSRTFFTIPPLARLASHAPVHTMRAAEIWNSAATILNECHIRSGQLPSPPRRYTPRVPCGICLPPLTFTRRRRRFEKTLLLKLLLTSS